MPIRNNISRQLNSLTKTLKKRGKYLTKAYQINKIIGELKEADNLLWTERWNHNGKYIDEEGREQKEEGVGVTHQNLSAYLKRKKSEVSNAQYRVRANRILEDRARDIRWRRIADRAHNRLAQQERLASRRYEPGVEERLGTMGLTPAQIEANPDPATRVDLYRRRTLEAPVARLAILADADRVSAAILERVRERPTTPSIIRGEGYDSEEGWGKKKKRKSRRKRRRRNKTKKQ